MSAAEIFKALVVDRDAEKRQFVEVRDLKLADLMEGDVVVRVSHSTVNYKDGLALTGKLPVVRRFPMIPGIDFCGTVESSENPNFKPGDDVILNGWGVGETHYGAYAKYARVKGDWLIRKPDGISSIDAMAIGTAGYTAMLAVIALERHDITPDRGSIVVTGAAGGVGSVAVALLKKLGYEVVAVTGRASEADYLKGLGAAEIVDREELVESRQAARQRALGWGYRHRRFERARQRHCDDRGRRRGCRLRQCRWHGPFNVGRAVHPARRLAHRHQLRHAAAAGARGGVGAARARPRPRQARSDDDDHRVRPDPRHGGTDRRGQGARPRGGGDRLGRGFLLRPPAHQEPLIEAADYDQRRAEPEERGGAKRAGQLRHVEQEDLEDHDGDDEA